MLNRDLVHAGYLGNDASHRSYGLAFDVDDRGGSQSGFFQAVEGVRAYCGALAGGEYQNYTSQRLTLQLVASLQHQPAFGIDPTEEGDAHLGHQGLTLTDARVNRATSQPYPLTFLHPFVFSLHITGFRNLRLNASETTSSKDR